MPPDGSTVVAYGWVAGGCSASLCGFRVLTSPTPDPNLTSAKPTPSLPLDFGAVLLKCL